MVKKKTYSQHAKESSFFFQSILHTFDIFHLMTTTQKQKHFHQSDPKMLRNTINTQPGGGSGSAFDGSQSLKSG